MTGETGTAPINSGDAPLPAWALAMLGAGLLGGMMRRRASGGVTALMSAMLLGVALSGLPEPGQAADLSLQYDANGNVSSKTTPSGSTAYTYDALDRLDTESGPAGSRNHDFDGNDNRLTDGAGSTATFTPNSDRLATVNGVAVTLDAAGNVTADGAYRYVWDAQNQLRELRTSGNALIASYFYDHRQLRSRKVTTAIAPQGAMTTYYHYDQQGRLIGESASSSVPLRTYVWNGDTLTGLIDHQPQRVVYTVQLDHLGSPFQVRSLEGKVLWRWESEAFGKTAPNEDVDSDTQKLTLNLRFPGQYYDRESGLHYNWHRYYSPKLARYLSPDPIGLAGGANRYTYVKGNPLKYVDPTGLAGVLPRPVPLPLPGPSSPGQSKPTDDGSYGGLFPPGTMPTPTDPYGPGINTERPIPEPIPPAPPRRPGTGCRAMFEACMRGANVCPSPVKQGMYGICLAAYFTCQAVGGDGPDMMSGSP